MNSAIKILTEYKGQEPFASFLKKYFSGNKKYGSKDRKYIGHLCYCYFRLGAPSHPSPAGKEIEDRILAGLFLCSHETNEILTALKPEWNERTELLLKEKLSFINYQLSSLFPWKEELSEGIDHDKFRASFFQQPDLFLRLRPGKEEIVLQKLASAGIQFKQISQNCLALPNATKIGSLIELDQEAVIQDYNSQKTGEFVKSAIANRKSEIKVWDCCAGSGGKSIMAYDLNPNIEITVSDIRENILVNLKKRFTRAGIKSYKSFKIDLSAANSRALPLGSGEGFDLIIADVPCTGSGTWSRTPEQLYFFDDEKIDEYAALQKKIISNIIPHLKPGSSLLYITCSVFRKENEDVADFIKANSSLQLKKMEVLKGYEQAADSMFAALFTASAP